MTAWGIPNTMTSHLAVEGPATLSEKRFKFAESQIPRRAFRLRQQLFLVPHIVTICSYNAEVKNERAKFSQAEKNEDVGRTLVRLGIRDGKPFLVARDRQSFVHIVIIGLRAFFRSLFFSRVAQNFA